jgi:preprotein translocase subunit SecA
MFELLRRLLPDPNERKVRTRMPLVDRINDLETEIARLSDDELRGKTVEFRRMLDQRERAPENIKRDRQLEKEVLDLLLPEAFAVVREGGKRALGMRHFDVQLIGGMVLHDGGISEMRTGEGKTLVATLPAYLNALTGKGVHVITVNDYLARRDAEWMGRLYRFLGLTTGMVLSEQRGFNNFMEKKQAYAADITYGTNNEFGFDYLRDNMAGSRAQLVQRDFNYAIIDEVDSILIDEARTPLIISGRLEQSAELYQSMALIAPQLIPVEDYTVDEKARNVVLTEEGIDHAQELLGIEDLFDIQHNMAHHLLQALKAKELFRADIDYVVKNGEAVIVDEFTGRLMEGRRWSDGLHQAVEAKEGVPIQDETQTLASITFQNLFRLYPKLGGMTGTAMTEEAEFGKIYDLGVTLIPTNRSDIRSNLSDTIYKNEAVKFYKVVEEIIGYHQLGRPVLVGTVSIEKSEYISMLLSNPSELTMHLRQKAARLIAALQQDSKNGPDLLRQLSADLETPERARAGRFEDLAEKQPDEIAQALIGVAETIRAVQAIAQGVPHQVLNAKHHEGEAMIVAQAGRSGAITIATNMAGRGTDILLGGNAELLAKSGYEAMGVDWREIPQEELDEAIERKKLLTEKDKERVVALGGLHIIGTERHESRRIDNQLRGRAARQGDPGSTHFFLSLEDGLMRKFGGDRIAGLMDMMGVDETMPISAGMVSRAIEGAQRKVEAYYFDIRKNILQYDDVLTEQRKLIYEQRRKVLDGENLRDSISHMIRQSLELIVNTHLPPQSSPEDWEEEAFNDMAATVVSICPALAVLDGSALKGKSAPQLIALFDENAQNAYRTLESELSRVSAELQETHGVALEGLETEGLPAGDAQNGDVTALSAEARHPLRRIERDILLSIIDSRWIDYLHNLDGLRDGIGLRAYGQKDPLIEYKREAFEMFQNLTYDIQRDTVMTLFNTQIEIQLEQQMEDGTPEALSVHHTALTDAMQAEHLMLQQFIPGEDGQAMLDLERAAALWTDNLDIDPLSSENIDLLSPQNVAIESYDVHQATAVEAEGYHLGQASQAPEEHSALGQEGASAFSGNDQQDEETPEEDRAENIPPANQLVDELERLRRARANKSKPF